MTIRGKTSAVSTDGSFARGGTAGSTTEISGRGYGETPGAGWAPTSREDRAMTLAEAGFPVYLRGTPEDREAFARHLASRLPSRTPAEVADTDRVRARVGLPPAGDTPIVVVPSNVTVQELGGTDQHPGLIAAANGGVLCMDANGLTSSHRAMVDEARDTGVARPPFEADGLPSRFALVTGGSVCPCGQEPCVCDAATIKRWKRKTTVSAPVRLDMTRVTDRTQPAPSRSHSDRGCCQCPWGPPGGHDRWDGERCRDRTGSRPGSGSDHTPGTFDRTPGSGHAQDGQNARRHPQRVRHEPGPCCRHPKRTARPVLVTDRLRSIREANPNTGV